MPVAAFVGALAATLLLYRIATREGRTSIAMFLLAGLAIAALANAGLGLLIFLADDRQLRDINFWMLGSLSGATWAKAAAIAPFLVGALSGGAVHRARPRRAGAGRDRGVLQRHPGRAAQAHLHRAGRRRDRRRGLGLRRDRLRRHRGAAPAAADDRPRPPPAAASGDAVRRDAAADRRYLRAHARRRRPNCRSASSPRRSERRSFSISCSASASCSGHDVAIQHERARGAFAVGADRRRPPARRRLAFDCGRRGASHWSGRMAPASRRCCGHSPANSPRTRAACC